MINYYLLRRGHSLDMPSACKRSFPGSCVCLYLLEDRLLAFNAKVNARRSYKGDFTYSRSIFENDIKKKKDILRCQGSCQFFSIVRRFDTDFSCVINVKFYH